MGCASFSRFTGEADEDLLDFIVTLLKHPDNAATPESVAAELEEFVGGEEAKVSLHLPTLPTRL